MYHSSVSSSAAINTKLTEATAAAVVRRNDSSGGDKPSMPSETIL